MTNAQGNRGWAAVIAAAGLIMLATSSVSVQAQSYEVLYSFQCSAPDGQYPTAGLVADKAGNLYGTTIQGGSSGYGTVFKIAPGGVETVLHNFAGPPADGRYPEAAGLVIDGGGNLYGVTSAGGPDQAGVVFKLAADGTESVLYSFTGGLDGYDPFGGLVRDSAGNLYGTTSLGGGWQYGVVFKLSPNGRETVLHDFNDIETDGAVPQDGLIQDAAGNLYGTTLEGGVNNAGTVFEVQPNGTETLLHSFIGPATDGAYPAGHGGRLLRDTVGNLYGATTGGGVYNSGTVFEVSATGAESILFNFNYSGNRGGGPSDGLVEDPAGNLYGTTEGGGSLGNGAIFKVSPAGKELVLHAFAGSPTDGESPNGGLIWGKVGDLYGTTQGGGAEGCGTVFKMVP